MYIRMRADICRYGADDMMPIIVTGQSTFSQGLAAPWRIWENGQRSGSGGGWIVVFADNIQHPRGDD